MEKEMRIRVADTLYRDTGRHKARIPPHFMRALDVMAGDTISIKGTRLTTAVVWPAHPEDTEKNIIRMDELQRQNAGVAINEYVFITKAEALDAESVSFALTENKFAFDDTMQRYIKNNLLHIPMTKGDALHVIILSNAIPFTVLQTRPEGIVKIVQTTLIDIEHETRQTQPPRYKVTYKDIGGLHEKVQRTRELIELPLRSPELFQRLGIEPPKGVLLYGPPGCGKTLLAKAVATETRANFISIKGPEIMSKFYGESEQQLREVFQKAQQTTPSIIFIDELDSIAPKRDDGVSEVERRVVAQLLSLMDGLENRGNVIVIGATNRINAIDSALRRPGRFDREIELGIPDPLERFEIFQIHTRNMPLADDMDIQHLSKVTHGYTGADIAALTREAALKALRRQLPILDLHDEPVSLTQLQTIEVTIEDFIAAFRELTPTTLREVFVDIPRIPWSMIGGLNEVKQRLIESVEWPIMHPERFKNMGITPSKGILLYGPPGCGKTLLAKAVATESALNFINIKGPELFSKWVGESEKAIREIFRKGRLAAPSIIFIDEIESLCPQRGSLDGGDPTERVISQLLGELDGLEALHNVIVLAATNRPDLLDHALLRPGRFDQLIYVPVPDETARSAILKIHTQTMHLHEDVAIPILVSLTQGYSGADIAALCREAGIQVLRLKQKYDGTSLADFRRALEEVKPSITPDMESWYHSIAQTFRKPPVQNLTPIV
jgi:transitional endoplasmic reticulum ATPase